MKQYFLLTTIAFLTACNSGKKENNNTNTADTVTMPLPETTRVTPPSGTGKIDIETFGDIKIGQVHTETIKILGEPDTKSKATEWGADGMMHEDWTYKTTGLVINMVSEKEDKVKSIFSITAKDPCTFKTRANKGIGSTYSEITEAYKRDIDTEQTDKARIIVGSVYGGIIFIFKNDKVESIFLGAAAE